ncbi:SH3 domain-containing protein [Bacillus sp. H-16]|uniref:SH3 domain-containing protein n=1 Tax=Alteribacter salitolerans TaxID=2912333 RepID=UPI001962A3B4|nr:SH3 domain-containing protein [Alteribacter salitolerans]MBM7095473.1 SH3 domain-containing protein [Alteribacter salitolerans]
MKKRLSLIVTVMIIIVLTGCGLGAEESGEAQEETDFNESDDSIVIAEGYRNIQPKRERDLGMYRKEETLTIEEELEQPADRAEEPVEDEKPQTKEVAQAEDEVPAETAPEQQEVTDASGTYYITAPSINVRSGGGTSYGVIGQIKQNEPVKVDGKTSNGWFRFEFQGQEGFVSGSFLGEEKVEVKAAVSSPGSTSSPAASSTSESSEEQEKEEPSSSSEETKTEEKKEELPAVARTKTASNTDQILTVVSTGGGSAKVEYWKKSGGTWNKEMSTNGFVGSNGVSANKVEGDRKAPTGAYRLGFAFGTENPGTKKSFRQITDNSYWISNVNDPEYNTWQERESSHAHDEHLIKYRDQYKYAMVINYNTHNPVSGKGSAIFLHISNGTPTLGCVSVPEAQMRMLMQELGDNAYIIIAGSESELAGY